MGTAAPRWDTKVFIENGGTVDDFGPVLAKVKVLFGFVANQRPRS